MKRRLRLRIRRRAGKEGLLLLNLISAVLVVAFLLILLNC